MIKGVDERFSCYSYGEGRTGIGQAVEFSFPCDVGAEKDETAEKVRQFLKENIRTIDIPTTGRVNVSHGGYGRYTRYDIKQHKYAGGGPGDDGGGGGYIEVLEIKNPPDGRWGIVIHEWQSGKGSTFAEWETLKNARDAYETIWSASSASEKFPKLSGFKRRVACGALTPWFYAVGDELLIGDYAFPEGLQDDPVYRIGKQFVVFDGDEIPSVKTCMGTRFVEEVYESWERKKTKNCFRLVYWDDGTVWNSSVDRGTPPRLIEESEAWIAEAVQQFKRLLAGKSTEFNINFTDGNMFVGRLVRAKRRVHTAEGDYFIVAHLKGKKEPMKGWVRSFKPTLKAPDIETYVAQRIKLKEEGDEVEHIQVKEWKTEKGGKKWEGVFFQRSV
jgi:hypothetical protein